MGLTDLKLDVEIKVTIKPMHLTFKDPPEPGQFERTQDIILKKKSVRWAGDKDLLEDFVNQAVDCIALQQPTVADRPPVIDIGEISGLSSTGVTINAMIDAHSVSTQATVNWHVSKHEIENDGDIQDASQSPMSGNDPAVASAILTGLTPNTRYYYRWRGKTADVQVWSELQSFKTLPS